MRQDKPDSYKGFLHLRCEHCGKERAFNIKTPINDYLCNCCGKVTELDKMRRVRFQCECGKTWQYMTNISDRFVETTCINCDSPMTAEMYKGGDYRPVKEGASGNA